MRFGPLNLTWWRKRPSVHVAERDDYTVIDMSAVIAELNPDMSAFTTMLMNLGKTSVFPERHHLTTVGDLVRDSKTGRSGKIIERRLKNPDDWFSLEREIVVEWNGSSTQPVYHWLEDDMMPRMAARS